MQLSSVPRSSFLLHSLRGGAIALAWALTVGACGSSRETGLPATGGASGTGGHASGTGGSALGTGGGSGGDAGGSGGTNGSSSGGGSPNTGGTGQATGGASSGGASPGSGGASGGAGGSAGASGGGAGGAGGRPATGGAAGGSAGGAGGGLGSLTSIFNGTTLDGWVANPAYWSVVDGAITGKSTGSFSGSFAMTKDDYTDFRIIVTMRKVVSTNHLGIGFWEPRPAGFGFYNCMLVIPPTSGIWDYTVKPAPGAFTPITHVAQVTINEAQWYTIEVLANFKTGTVRVAANGVEVLRYQNTAHAPYTKGPIALQLHGFNGTQEAQYKDVFVEASPTEDRLLTVK